MAKNSRNKASIARRLAAGLRPAIVLLLVGASGSQALEPSTSGPIAVVVDAWGRPAGVPSDYVPTPNGWAHPSCIIRIGEGERLLPGNVIGRLDGREERIAPCRFARYRRTGARIVGDVGAPTADGYIAQADSVTTAPQWLSATWTVPPAPASSAGQTLYFFPGLVPSATPPFGQTRRILQPVLAWNGLNPATGTAWPGWSISSWNCCPEGNQHASDLVSVAAGETISGYVWGTTCNAATHLCDTWQVRTSSNNSSSTLPTDSGTDVLDWVFGGAMEVYGLTACNQYPATTSVTFQNLNVTAIGGAQFVPAWQPSVTPGVTPNCSIGAHANGSSVTVDWCIPTTCAGQCGTIADGCGGTLNCAACNPYGGCRSGYKCCEPGVTQCELCVPTRNNCP